MILCDGLLNLGTINNMQKTQSATSLLLGPWETAFSIEINDKIKSKSNYRRGNKKIQSWKPYKKFENDLALVISTEIPDNWYLGEKEKAVRDRPIIVATIISETNLDSSNVSKSILDACEGLLYYNDASVKITTTVTEKPLKRNQDCKTVIAFALLSPYATLSEQIAASKVLLEKTKEAYKR